MRQGRRLLERHAGRHRARTPAPGRRRTRRRRPVRTRTGRRRPRRPAGTAVTPGPTASTTPATSIPRRWFLGARRPMNSRTKDGRGLMPSRSARLTEAAGRGRAPRRRPASGVDLAELDDVRGSRSGRERRPSCVDLPRSMVARRLDRAPVACEERVEACRISSCSPGRRRSRPRWRPGARRPRPLRAGLATVGGRPRAGGSALGLMVARDIDVTTVSRPLERRDRVRRRAPARRAIHESVDSFRNDTGRWRTRAAVSRWPVLDGRVRDRGGVVWKLDLWFILEGTPSSTSSTSGHSRPGSITRRASRSCGSRRPSAPAVDFRRDRATGSTRPCSTTGSGRPRIPPLRGRQAPSNST